MYMFYLLLSGSFFFLPPSPLVPSYGEGGEGDPCRPTFSQIYPGLLYGKRILFKRDARHKRVL